MFSIKLLRLLFSQDSAAIPSSSSTIYLATRVFLRRCFPGAHSRQSNMLVRLGDPRSMLTSLITNRTGHEVSTKASHVNLERSPKDILDARLIDHFGRVHKPHQDQRHRSLIATFTYTPTQHSQNLQHLPLINY